MSKTQDKTLRVSVSIGTQTFVETNTRIVIFDCIPEFTFPSSKKVQFGNPEQVYDAVKENKNPEDCVVNYYDVQLSKYKFNRYESVLNSIQKKVNEVSVDPKSGVITVKTTRSFEESLKITLIVGSQEISS